MRLGVEDDWAFTSGAANANQAIAAADQLRAGVIRVVVMWADVRGASAYSWLPPQRSALYRHAFTKVKHVDAVDQVLIGETSPYAQRRRAIAPLAFLRAVLCCHLRTDGYARSSPVIDR